MEVVEGDDGVRMRGCEGSRVRGFEVEGRKTERQKVNGEGS